MMMKNDNPMISILVPVYGVEKYIKQCALSLLEQDYLNIEYVFVNDCTKDNSIIILENLIQRYPERINNIKIINHSKNKGLAAARNTALYNCSGDYILPIDSDDFLTDKLAISKLVKKIIEEKSDVVFYDMLKYPAKECFTYKGISLDPISFTKNIIERNIPMSICGGLYRKAIFIDNKICSNEKISMGEDYAIKPLLTYYMKKISYLHEPLYGYRQENSSSITYNFKSRFVSDLRLCLDGFKEFFNDKTQFRESILIAEIKCKLLCLELWISSENSSIKDFNLIQEKFPTIHGYISTLTSKEKMYYLTRTWSVGYLLKFLLKMKKLLK